MNSPNKNALDQLFHITQKLEISDWCIASGARNAPIINLLHQHNLGKVHHFFDERSAGFFALGQCVQKQKPVAIVTTSGTAVAEILPAIIEAYYSNQPLVIISADRPVTFSGSGAPQTIDQNNIFGSYTKRIQLTGTSLPINEIEPLTSFPLHINIHLEEPLLDNLDSIQINSTPNIIQTPSLALEETDTHLLTNLLTKHSNDILFISGSLTPEKGKALAELSDHYKIPLWSEAISNVPPHEYSLSHSEILYRNESLYLKIVIRFGSVPTARFWRDLENLGQIEVYSCDCPPFPGLARNSTQLKTTIEAIPLVDSSQPARTSTLTTQDETYNNRILSLLKKHPNSEPSLLYHLGLCLSEERTIFLGNSLPIREWNLIYKLLKKVKVPTYYANRGANGIDGAISTFYGLTAEEATPSIAILGDLTALYDMNAPWIIPQMKKANRALVVINNQGGKIFQQVKGLQNADEQTINSIQNCHQHSLEGMANQWGLKWNKVESNAEFIDIEFPIDGILEIRPCNSETIQFWEAYEKLS